MNKISQGKKYISSKCSIIELIHLRTYYLILLKAPKVSYSLSCTAAQCDNTIGLICSANTCNCPSTKFWNGTACRKIKTF